LIELWFHSPSLQKKWERRLMPFLVVIIQHKLLMELKGWKLSKISRTGSEPGLLKDRGCTMVTSQCKSLARIHLTQLSLTLAHLNFLFHLMYLRKSDKSGLLLSLI
jgi:hypothetical protein